jgi:uncharacterized protein (DUF433 family)
MKAAESTNHIVRDKQRIPWIKGKNVKVIEVALDHLAYGWSADAIHEQHPSLSLAEIHSALAFYYDHQEEMDAQIARQAKELKALRSTTGRSSLQHRLHVMAKPL